MSNFISKYDPSKFLTTKELASRLRVSESWLHKNRLSNNPIPSIKLGGFIFYVWDEVIEWLYKNNKNVKTLKKLKETVFDTDESKQNPE